MTGRRGPGHSPGPPAHSRLLAGPRESSQQPEGSMKLIPVISRRPGGRRARRLPPFVTITASLALLSPLSFAAPALAGPAHPGGATSCPWLNQSLPISQRVHLLLSKMTLANEITMVEGQGTSQPYVFYM